MDDTAQTALSKKPNTEAVQGKVIDRDMLRNIIQGELVKVREAREIADARATEQFQKLGFTMKVSSNIGMCEDLAERLLALI